MTIKEYQKKENKKKQAYSYFITKGYSPEAASGIVGNLLHESGLNPKIEGDIGLQNGSSYGLAQWRGDRLNRLKKMYGDGWTDFNNQLEFVDWELNNTHKNAGKMLRQSKDIYDAGRIFSDYYEIPQKKYNQDKNRQANVNNVATLIENTPTDTKSYIPVIQETTIVTNLPKSEEIINLAEETKKLEQQAKEKEQRFLQEYRNIFTQVQPQEQFEKTQQELPQVNYEDIFKQVSQFVDTPLAQQGGNIKIGNLTNEQALDIEKQREWLNNWNKNRQINGVTLNSGVEIPFSKNIYIDDLNYENPNTRTYGEFDSVTNRILFDEKYQDKGGIPSHEFTHRFQKDLKNVNPNIYTEYIDNPIKEITKNKTGFSDYVLDPEEVHSEINRLRYNAGFKPQQIIEEKDINDLNISGYNLNQFSKEDLIKLLNSTAYLNNLDSSFYAQQGKFIDNIKKDFGGKAKPKQMYLVEDSQEYKRYKEKDKYFNPDKRKGITTGDWKQDLVYENDWLLNTPIVGDYIKNQAIKIAKASGGAPFLNKEEVIDSQNSNKINYTGGDREGVTLIDQYFSDKPLYKTAKYKPNSDYLEFLPTYSLKDKFENDPKKQKIFNQELINFMFKGNEEKYDEFVKNKKPIYRKAIDGSEIADLLEVDLGGHKTGAAWDTKVNLPYVSISDAWDFEPEAYSKKWDGTQLSDPDKETEAKKEKSFIQSYLMHKAGNPFKIYDRFYFDPKTKKYIPDSEIDKLRPKKQQGGQFTENELKFLSDIAVKDKNGYWNENNHGKIVQIPSNSITMEGVQQALRGISLETGEEKLMFPQRKYYFKNTQNVIELPIK